MTLLGTPNFDEREENASVEVARWGSEIWLTIRSEQSVGKSIGLSIAEAEEVASLLQRSAGSTLRRVQDEPPSRFK